jgi:hypothetical protein
MNLRLDHAYSLRLFDIGHIAADINVRFELFDFAKKDLLVVAILMKPVSALIGYRIGTQAQWFSQTRHSG